VHDFLIPYPVVTKKTVTKPKDKLVVRRRCVRIANFCMSTIERGRVLRLGWSPVERNFCGTLDWWPLPLVGVVKIVRSAFLKQPRPQQLWRLPDRWPLKREGESPAVHNHTSPHRTSYDRGATLDKNCNNRLGLSGSVVLAQQLNVRSGYAQ
jgi:hypothetical protein